MSKYGSIDAYVIGTPWKLYIQKLNFYFKANEITDETKQRNIFLTACGDKTFAIADSLVKPAKLEDVSFKDLIQKLEQHFNPEPNPIVERFMFNKRDQAPGEAITDYIAELRRLSDTCKFTDLDDRLRDRIVCGVRDEALKHCLFEEGPSLTLAKAIEMAIASEFALRSVQEVRNSSPLHKIHQGIGPYKNKGNVENKILSEKNSKSKACFRCGDLHNADSCKFKNTQCRFCSKVGHIERACITKKYKNKHGMKTSKGKNNNLQISSTNSVTNKLEATSMYHMAAPLNLISSSPPVIKTVQLNGQALQMEIDSGAGHSIISENTYNSLWQGKSKPVLSKENLWLKTWTQEQFPVLGSISVLVSTDSRKATLPLLVASGSGPNLIGRNWFDSLGIEISTIFSLESKILTRYSDLFEDKIGKFAGPPVSIEIENNAKPIFFKSRPVPFALKPRIEDELNRLEEEGIIEKVLSSKWGTPIVPVVKSNGKIRICGDYSATVNKVIRKAVYPLPTANEIFSKLAGCVVFSKLDMNNAYLQLEVDEESADILTLNTCKGLYRVKRLPYGLASAPGLFQRFLDNLLAGLDHVANLLDDVIIGGKNIDELWKTVDEVLMRLSKAGLRLNKQKCVFNSSSVHFLGFVVDKNGIHPTQEKIEAIHNAPTPKNKATLQAFLGLYNFYERFLPQKSTILEPLHRLLDKGSPWSWTEIHENSFQEAKKLLKSDSVLTHYDENKPLILACDASPYGVGAVISHINPDGTEQPIAYGSRTLSKPERNYAQIDKEAMAIIFGLRKFHQFLYGRKFLIVTDHKPLISLFNPYRQMPTVISPRMLRWRLILSAYNYDIQHRPGKEMKHADALSRLPMQAAESEVPSPADILMLEGVSDSPITATVIAYQTRKDPVLSRVLRFTRHGWPEEKPSAEFSPFFSRKNELSVHRDCLLWGSRVIIPEKLRSEVLHLLHASHLGIVQTKAVARSYIWWPRLDQDIENIVKNCITCQTNRKDPPKAPPVPWIWSAKPWSRLHIDFAGPFRGHIFLIVVDSTSKWPEVKIVNSMSSGTVIHCLREIFCTHGLPDVIVSDNGAAFISTEFQEFLKKNGIRHITSSPYHPSSNGQAERYVQSVKDKLKKLTSGDIHTKVCRLLLSLRTTPHTETGISPAEKLMNRCPKTLLEKLHPDSLPSKAEERRTNLTSKRNLREFEIDDSVYYRKYNDNSEKWTPGYISAKKGPVSYEVTSKEGVTEHRHIDQIQSRPEPIIQQGNSEDCQPSSEIKIDDSAPTPVSSETPIPVDSASTPLASVPRRSERVRHPPKHLEDYVRH